MTKVSVYTGDNKLIYSQFDASIGSTINSAVECMLMNGMRDAVDAVNQTEVSEWEFLQRSGYRIEVEELK